MLWQKLLLWLIGFQSYDLLSIVIIENFYYVYNVHKLTCKTVLEQGGGMVRLGKGGHIWFLFFSGKAEIIEFLQTNRLGSLEALSLQDQYKKTRTKIYNSRKTKRQITRKGLKKLGAI